MIQILRLTGERMMRNEEKCERKISPLLSIRHNHYSILGQPFLHFRAAFSKVLTLDLL